MMSFVRLLNHLAGREDATVRAQLAAGALPAADVTAARRLLAAGRRALTAPKLSRKLRRRALKIFRDAQRANRANRADRADRPSTVGSPVLRLVLDTLLRPAPALRSSATAPTRFLRFGGDLTIELQITPRARGLELRGQVTPPGDAEAVVLRAGRRTMRAAIDADGIFVLRGVPRRTIELDFGVARITDLAL